MRIPPSTINYLPMKAKILSLFLIASAPWCVQSWSQAIPVASSGRKSYYSSPATSLRQVIFSKRLPDDDAELKLIVNTTSFKVDFNDDESYQLSPPLSSSLSSPTTTTTTTTNNEEPNPLVLGTAILIGTIIGLGLHLTPLAGALKDMLVLTVVLHWALWSLTNPPIALAFDFVCISDLLYESTVRVNL